MTIGRSRPEWLDDALYPFEDRWAAIDGHLVHYVDEGDGPIAEAIRRWWDEVVAPESPPAEPRANAGRAHDPNRSCPT
jgi:hypothetical protein